MPSDGVSSGVIAGRVSDAWGSGGTSADLGMSLVDAEDADGSGRFVEDIS